MKCLVVYFSASGITKKVADLMAKAGGFDLYEIKPEVPYTDADLNWMDKNSRSSIEMKDKNSRPAIIKENLNVDDYDVFFVGFPIWWYIAPTIINTFLESFKFIDKRIILFATSGGSGFGKAVSNLINSVDGSTTIEEGKILKRNVSEEQLQTWFKELNVI